MQHAKHMTLQELIDRATEGQPLNRHHLFRPSLTYQVLNDPFWIWCEYYAPKEEAVDETSRYDEMCYQQGIEYEQTWVKEHYPDALKIEPDYGYDALRHTCQAMLDGVNAIYQPQLWNLGRGIYGKADLLVRDNSRGSDLGSYHYRVVEIKRSGSLKEYHTLQAAFYNRMLVHMQGYTPGKVSIVLKEKVEHVPLLNIDDELDEVLNKWKALREGQYIPEPGRPPDATSSPWRIYGNKWVNEKKHLILLAGLGARERGRLRSAGIDRIDQLWNLRLEAVCEILGEQNGAVAYHVAQAYRMNQPIKKLSYSLVIPRAKRSLYFDFETSDDVHPTVPPHVYLIGVWDAEEERFAYFLARGASDEERIFREFLNYVGDLENIRLYHWTDFEIGEINKVIKRWPALEESLNKLTHSCVDLKEAIKKAVYLPVPTYSIKCVAPALGFKWQQEQFGAFNAMVCYWDYLDQVDESAIQKAILYNKDDCLAMYHVDRVLARHTVPGVDGC